MFCNRLLLTILLGFFIASCTTKPYISKAQAEQQALNAKFSGAIAYWNECGEKNADNPDVVLSYEQITLKGLNPENRSELLASNKKLNAKQKSAYQNFVKLGDECFAGIMTRLQGTPYTSLLQGTEAVFAVNDSNLINQKITIGEGNAKKLELWNKFLTDLSTLQQQLAIQFGQAHNAEVTIKAGNEAVEATIYQGAITRMNINTQIQQNQMSQQLLNQYRAPQYNPSLNMFGR
jgi:hypothetical protein